MIGGSGSGRKLYAETINSPVAPSAKATTTILQQQRQQQTASGQQELASGRLYSTGIDTQFQRSNGKGSAKPSSARQQQQLPLLQDSAPVISSSNRGCTNSKNNCNTIFKLPSSFSSSRAKNAFFAKHRLRRAINRPVPPRSPSLLPASRASSIAFCETRATDHLQHSLQCQNNEQAHSTDYQVDQANLGEEHLEESSRHSPPIHNLSEGRREKSSRTSSGRSRGSVLQSGIEEDEEVPEGQHEAHIRQNSENASPTVRLQRIPRRQHVRLGDVCGSGRRSYQASHPSNTRPSEARPHQGDVPHEETHQGKARTPRHGNLLVLEDSFKNRRHSETHQRKFSHQTNARQRNSHRMGNKNQDDPSTTIQSNRLHSGSRGGNSNDDSKLESNDRFPQQGPTTLPDVIKVNLQMVETGPEDEGPIVSLFQEGCGKLSDGQGCEGRSRSSSYSSAVKTHRSASSISGSNNSLRNKQSGAGKSTKISRSNEITLDEDKINNNNNASNVNISSSSVTSSSLLDANNNFQTKDKKSSHSSDITKQMANDNTGEFDFLLKDQQWMNEVRWQVALKNSNKNKNTKTSLKHCLTRKTTSSKLPTPAQQQSIPLHARFVELLNLGRVESLMNEQTKKRFKKLQDMAFKDFFEFMKEKQSKTNSFAPISSPAPVSIETDDQQQKNNNNYNNNNNYHSSSIPAYMSQHAEILASNNHIELVDTAKHGATIAEGIPFNVYEKKGNGDERLRFIFWTKTLNEFLADKYEANMSNLKHQSSYADAVRQECAATGDMAISFFQVPIPAKYRCLFRFQDDAGKLWQLTRLPMGLCVSCEIMQLIVETLVGCPWCVQPSAVIDGEKVPLTNKRVSEKVWVDGFQVSGAADDVEIAAARIRKVAKYCGVTWKDEGVAVAKNYDFVGLNFDHEKHIVRVSDKTLNKLPDSVFHAGDEILTSELEKFVSRLIFCTSAIRIPPAYYYYALKWTNRQIFNNLNREGVDRKIQLPRSICSDLNRWNSDARKQLFLDPNLHKNNNKTGAFDILFSDASIHGWGAFFISSDGEIAIIGGKWQDGVKADSSNIACLEALALEYSLKAFANRLLKNRNVDLRIDNSSVVAGVKKGKAKLSPELNDELKKSLKWLVDNDFLYSVMYVNTKDNWSDGPSRGIADIPPEYTRTVASRSLYSNRGIKGLAGRSGALSHSTQKPQG